MGAHRALARPVCAALAAALLAAACGLTDPTTVDPGPTTTSPPPTTTSPPSGTTIAPSCHVGEAPAEPRCVVFVPDPRPGDLRVDPGADVLPADYEPVEVDRVVEGLSYGPEPEQLLDLYLPATRPAPVVVFLHSGGWVGGTRVYVPAMVLRFVELGYAVAAVDYRLAPDNAWPEPLQDVKRAVRWLKADPSAVELVDADRLIVYGTSAGGHLAAMAGATPGTFEPGDLSAAMAAVDSSVDGIVSIVGPTDLTTFYTTAHDWPEGLTEALLGCDPCGADELAAASIHAHLDGTQPAAYWAYGEDDCLVDPVTQGTVAATAWAANAEPRSSWFDLIEGCAHNVDQSLLNQRWVESFVETVMTSALV